MSTTAPSYPLCPTEDIPSRGVSRRTFLKTTMVGAAAALARPAIASAAPAVIRKRSPNLIFINVDQLSHFALPRFGCTQVQTPNLDRLAQRGTSFEQSYCADPLCGPSRACWFTGRAPTETGVVFNGMPLRPEIPDLATWLRKAGYDNFFVGKWHISRKVEDCFHVFHEACNIGEHSDAAISRSCETFLARRTSSTPFFLTVGLMNPHDICGWVALNKDVPAEFRYPGLANQLPPLPPNFKYDPREPEFFVAFLRHVNEKNYSKSWSETAWRYYIWSYYRQVEMVDATLGRILDALENSPQADNTLVVFSSDHGDAMGCHRLFHKLSCYEHAMRVPLIVSWPGQVAENHIDSTHLVSGLDLTPTLCDYAGTVSPPDMRGRSLREVLEQRNPPWRDYVVSHCFVIGRMVRSARHKYIAYQGDKTDQLFDLVNDPDEKKNLSGETVTASLLADHRQMLAEWEAQLKPAPAPPGGWLNKVLGPRWKMRRQT